ncbi:MAG: fibronectin type III domain-containing protein [Candidatus Omnitrophica bacterium]|nr:fibronectin type III domain-containing protein [Candidatus Omnitrophota bacterium]
MIRIDKKLVNTGFFVTGRIKHFLILRGIIKMSRLRKIFSLAVFVLGITAGLNNVFAGSEDPRITWLKVNTSKDTGLPYSFQLPADPDRRKQILEGITADKPKDAIIERVIVSQGLEVYDGACWQIALVATGDKETNLPLARVPIDKYWDGDLPHLWAIRGGYSKINSNQQFVYDPKNPGVISEGPYNPGSRGFIFRIIDADGRWETPDPLDGKTHSPDFPGPEYDKGLIVWQDWRPIAGENAWVVMAALQRFHAKYYDAINKRYSVPSQDIITYVTDRTMREAKESALVRELARCALILQADNGGIRVAPIGTYYAPGSGDDWYYNEIFTENNCSWYAAFRMLYAVTGDGQYKNAMDGIERYLKSAWDPQDKIFYQGTHYNNGAWEFNIATPFAVDCQTWAICVLGPERIDSWFGEGSAYNMWQKAKQLSGYTVQGKLLGVGYSTEHDRMSIEWTAGAVLACRIMSDYYKNTHPDWSLQASQDAQSMREGIDGDGTNVFKHQVAADQVGYSYSSKRAPIPFGWNSLDPDVLSTTSTAWVYFLDSGFNPFILGGKTAFTPSDCTPPSTPRVSVSINTVLIDQLYASWRSQDLESGILEYRYKITEGSIDGLVVRDWTRVRGVNYVTAGALNLTIGKTYYFSVQAENNVGLWSQTGYSSGTTVIAKKPPQPMADLFAAGISTSEIKLLMMDNVLNQKDGVKIERSIDGQAFTQIANISPYAGFIDSGLEANKTYFYRCRLYNSAGESSYTPGPGEPLASATTFAPLDTTAPSTPVVRDDGDFTENTKSLTASFTSEDKESGVVQYMYRITKDMPTGEAITDFKFVDKQPGIGIVVLQSGLRLTEGKTYYFAVRAKNGAGLWSETGYSDGITIRTVPATPTGLTAGAVSTSQIKLSWKDNAKNETGFKIERSLSANSGFTRIASVGANVTTYNNTGLKSGTAYNYRVRAYNSSGNTAYIATNTTTLTVAAPTNLTASAVSTNQIKLSWKDNANNESGFKIERSLKASSGFTRIASVGANVTTYNNAGLNPGTTYYYRVCAYDSSANSAYSNSVSVTTSKKK